MHCDRRTAERKFPSQILQYKSAVGGSEWSRSPDGIFIQETHKELLRFAQTQNNSNEVACLLDLTTGEKLDFVKGDQVSVDVEADAASYHWLRTRPLTALCCAIITLGRVTFP